MKSMKLGFISAMVLTVTCTDGTVHADEYDHMFKSVSSVVNGGCIMGNPEINQKELANQLSLFLKSCDSPIGSPFTCIVGTRNGYPDLKDVKPVPDKRTLFYATEAVWSVPVTAISPSMAMNYKFDQTKPSIKATSDLVDVYLIPLQSASQFFSDTELRSSANKKQIAIKNLDEQLLDGLRRERYSFFKHHAHELDRESISRFQDYLTKKYESLFYKKEVATEAATSSLKPR